jgi:phosphate transport system substrate-binding protein
MKKSGHWSSALVITLVLVTALAVALVPAGCGSSNSSSSGSSASAAATASGSILGAGSSFAFPIFSKWASDYASSSGVKLNYQAIGSGGGIADIEAKTVDFGASDAPMKQADLTTNHLVQFPVIVGGVVPVINVKGIAQGVLKLNAVTLAKIYSGAIKTWNDPAIKALNPGLTLPATAIAVVHRSDASGTTWIFTHYLTAAAPSAWTVGADKSVNWPVGVGGKGNDGVAGNVKQLNGSIGYVEYAYAKQNGMNWAQMENKAGKFVAPSVPAFQAAAAGADWKNAPGFYLVLVDQPGATTWPITGATFVLMQKDQADVTRPQMTLQFLDWAFKSGVADAQGLDYVPLPASVVTLVEQSWSNIMVSGTPVWPM